MANKIRVNVNGEPMIFEGVRRIAYDDPDHEGAQVHFVAENELVDKIITANGTYNPPINTQGFKRVVVDVPSDALNKFDYQVVVGADFHVPYSSDTDGVKITPEGLLSYYDDGDGYYIFTALGEGFATIELIHADEAEAGYEVNVIDEKNIILPYGYVKPSGKLTIKENGTYNVRNYESVEVNVSTSENLDTDLTSIESKIADLNAILDELGAVGYTVTIQGAYDEDYGACATYSLDNGSTWESINGYDLVLDNVKEIMFKRVGDAPIDEMKYWKESEYDEDLDPIDYDDFYFNQNYTLTENTTFRFYAAW